MPKSKCFGGDLYLTSAYDDWEYKGHVVDGQTTDLKRVLLAPLLSIRSQAHSPLCLGQLDAWLRAL